PRCAVEYPEGCRGWFQSVLRDSGRDAEYQLGDQAGLGNQRFPGSDEQHRPGWIGPALRRRRAGCRTGEFVRHVARRGHRRRRRAGGLGAAEQCPSNVIARPYAHGVTGVRVLAAGAALALVLAGCASKGTQNQTGDTVNLGASMSLSGALEKEGKLTQQGYTTASAR